MNHLPKIKWTWFRIERDGYETLDAITFMDSEGRFTDPTGNYKYALQQKVARAISTHFTIQRLTDRGNQQLTKEYFDGVHYSRLVQIAKQNIDVPSINIQQVTI